MRGHELPALRRCGGSAASARALSGPQAGLLRRLRNGAFNSAAANVVLGERMAAVVVRAGAPANRIRVIPN